MFRPPASSPLHVVKRLRPSHSVDLTTLLREVSFDSSNSRRYLLAVYTFILFRTFFQRTYRFVLVCLCDYLIRHVFPPGFSPPSSQGPWLLDLSFHRYCLADTWHMVSCTQLMLLLTEWMNVDTWSFLGFACTEISEKVFGALKNTWL